jgi:hypothetical protein
VRRYWLLVALALVLGVGLGWVAKGSTGRGPDRPVVPGAKWEPVSPDEITVQVPGRDGPVSVRFPVTLVQTQADVQGVLAEDECKVILWYLPDRDGSPTRYISCRGTPR